MAVQTSVFIASSVDGFIARPDGNLDWLVDNGISSEGDYGYGEFFATVDTMVLGRKTFETVLGFGQWPYGSTRVYVLSRTPQALQIPRDLTDRVLATNASPRELLSGIQDAGGKHAYIDGGQAIQSFLREGLLGSITLTRIPVLLGSGIPLFGTLPADVWLEVLDTRSFESGYVQTRYRIRT